MADTPTSPTNSGSRNWLLIVTLILAGEAIFFLPFVIPRVFRPTLLEVFGINNTQLGMAFFTYGVVAMLAYFPGGPLADRYGARRLMTLALISTSIGGLVLATIPENRTLLWLYGFWGMSTILVFWAALIRATRYWGGEALQGSAFGLLDGGRGLVAASIGSLTVFCYSLLLPENVETASLEDRTFAFRMVILIFSGVTFLSALLVWVVLPTSEANTADSEPSEFKRADAWLSVRRAAEMPVVWIQALIILCAYVAYKGLDDVSLYAKESLGFNEVNAAYIGTVSMWMRPFAAIGAGVVADRVRVTTVTWISFAVLTIGSSVIATGTLHRYDLEGGMMIVFFITITGTSAAVFALRGLYFAIMREGRIPFRFTGSAVGIVSVIGYTPDIFMGPLMGVLLDCSPGDLGHQHVFGVIAAFSIMGLLATLWFQKLVTRDRSAV